MDPIYWFGLIVCNSLKKLHPTFFPVEHVEIISHITEVKRVANEVYDFWLAFQMKRKHNDWK